MSENTVGLIVWLSFVGCILVMTLKSVDDE